MKSTTLLATACCMFACSVANADYIQFSQYDGKKTWNNFRVDVEDAFSYKQTGSVYFRGIDRGAMAGTPSTEEVFWVSGEITRTFPICTMTSCGSTDNATLQVRFYKASPDSTYYDLADRYIYSGVEVNAETGEIAGPLVVTAGKRMPVSDPEMSDGDTFQTSVVIKEGQDYAPATAGTPSRDAEATETHLVVPVPTDAVMADFIYDYLNAKD